VRLLIRGGDDADAVHAPVFANFTGSAKPFGGFRHPPIDALLIRVGDLPQGRIVFDALLGPGVDHHLDLLFEDAAINLVVDAAVGVGGAAAQVLADDVGPTVLIAAGESDKEAAFEEMVEDGGLLGDTDGVLGAHHVAGGADVEILGDRAPAGGKDAGVGAHFVALGVEVVLDSTNAPDAQLVAGADDVIAAQDGFVVALDVAADRAQGGAFVLIFGVDERVDLQHDLDHRAFLLGCR
jgi:hypothetical protein